MTTFRTEFKYCLGTQARNGVYVLPLPLPNTNVTSCTGSEAARGCPGLKQWSAGRGWEPLRFYMDLTRRAASVTLWWLSQLCHKRHRAQWFWIQIPTEGPPCVTSLCSWFFIFNSHTEEGDGGGGSGGGGGGSGSTDVTSLIGLSWGQSATIVTCQSFRIMTGKQ